MAYRRRYYRRSSGYGRRRTFRRRPTRRRYRRTYRRRVSKTTKSAVVKLTWETTFTCGSTEASGSGYTSKWVPVTFYPRNVPGFLDYSSTYGQYRILKANMRMERTVLYGPPSNPTQYNYTTAHYLTSPSRSFALSVAQHPFTNPENAVPAQTEETLRQTRWQREFHPSSTATYVRIGFKPYTAVVTNGPASSNIDANFLRVWEGRNWTPMAWADAIPNETNPSSNICYFGPYVVPSRNFDNTDVSSAGAYGFTIPVTMELYVQFRAQK